MESFTSLGDVCHKLLSHTGVLHKLFCPEIRHRWGSQVALRIDIAVRGLPGVKCFTNCEMHYINSNPNGMADAGIKSTSKVCKNCTVFGNYDEIPLLIVRIIDHLNKKLDYNMYPAYHADALWFHHNSRKCQCQLFVIQTKSKRGWITW